MSTPRTDAKHGKLVKDSESPLTWIAGKDYADMRKHAEKLERELSRVTAERDELGVIAGMWQTRMLRAVDELSQLMDTLDEAPRK